MKKIRISTAFSGKNIVRGGDIMNFSKKTGKKKAAAAAVICFVAAIAITGTYTFNDYKKSKNEKEIVMAEEQALTKEKYTVTDENPLADEAVDGEIVANETETSVYVESDVESSELPDEEIEITEETAAADAVSVSFAADSLILWPVSGSLLMDYSMDKTIYFKTLDQYRYNPAIIIAAAENDQIIAGAPGLVKSIDHFAQTGTTVNIDLGNGYEALYGQLQNVPVKTGEYVDATTTLGYVAQPTKYYSREGTNLYFEMRKDGRPVDPKEYLVE